jgi:hypothetical protein
MNKSLALAVIAVVVALVAGVGALTMNPASNALADSADTAQTIVVRDGSGNFAANSISLDGPFQLKSKTLAQLQLLVPTAGDVYFCSNCTGALGATGKILVATGTSAGNFADAAGGIFK